ncbi:hypothetical protein U1Q18_030738 [Sarracenia purpurea var. burkii]
MERKSYRGRLGYHDSDVRGGTQAKQYGPWRVQSWITKIFIDNLLDMINNRRLGHILEHCGVVSKSIHLYHEEKEDEIQIWLCYVRQAPKSKPG